MIEPLVEEARKAGQESEPISRDRLEQLLAACFGAPFGRPDKKYEVGWAFGDRLSIVVDRRSREPRLFLPLGGNLRLLHGLIRCMKSAGSPMSSLTKPYPGFAENGRVELVIQSHFALAASYDYLLSFDGADALLPSSPWRNVVRPPARPIDVTKSTLESEIHAHVVSFWDEIPIFSQWRLRDTELSFNRTEGRADLYAAHKQKTDQHLVIELKRGGGDDRYVVGQLLEYMATISIERQLPTAWMRGMILCTRASERLKLMVSRVDGIELVPLESANVRAST